MITVYADVMFAVNFLMDLLLLKLTSAFCKKTSRLRLFAGAFIGALYSTVIFFGSVNPAISVILNILVSAVMLLAAFGYGGRRELFMRAGIFYGISFLCGGICFVLFMHGKAFAANGTVYFDESVRKLIFGGAAAYYIVWLLTGILKKITVKKNGYVRVKMSLGKNDVEFSAFTDTGNLLTEPLSGLPVCIMGRGIFSKLTENENPQLYIIPYKTVEKTSGALIGVKPSRVFITETDGKICETECIAAAADIRIDSEAEGLVSPLMINYRKELTPE